MTFYSDPDRSIPDPESFIRYGGDCICGAVYAYAGIPEPGGFAPDCPTHGDPLYLLPDGNVVRAREGAIYDTERFIAAIRQTIETQLAHLMDEHDRREGVILLPNEGTSIDTNALAQAVHAAVVEHLGPPF